MLVEFGRWTSRRLKTFKRNSLCVGLNLFERHPIPKLTRQGVSYVAILEEGQKTRYTVRKSSNSHILIDRMEDIKICLPIHDGSKETNN